MLLLKAIHQPTIPLRGKKQSSNKGLYHYPWIQSPWSCSSSNKPHCPYHTLFVLPFPSVWNSLFLGFTYGLLPQFLQISERTSLTPCIKQPIIYLCLLYPCQFPLQHLPPPDWTHYNCQHPRVVSGYLTGQHRLQELKQCGGKKPSLRQK